jgi:hypothetical protein
MPQNLSLSSGEEREPLITNPPSPTASTTSQEETRPRRGLRNTNSRHILLCVFALIVLNQFCWYLLEVPTVSLVEMVICERYYENNGHAVDLQSNGGVGERLCKIPAIQSELAKIVGLKPMFDAIPSE